MITAAEPRSIDSRPSTIRRLPISIVIATAGRPDAIAACFATLLEQTVAVSEVVVVDASDDDRTRRVCDRWLARFPKGRWEPASTRGAAAQRNSGLAFADQPYVLFVDDDVELEPACTERLWSAVTSDPRIGGASAMIVNQRYASPGWFTRLMFRAAGSGGDPFPAGRCLGPAFNVLPADRPDLPPIVPVEWLNTTCTLYRRDVLPVPAFAEHFEGYSVGEDLDLSLAIGRDRKLVNARTARVVHHSRTGPYKPDHSGMAEMTLVNRHYVMTRTLGRTSLTDYLRLAGIEALLVVSTLRSRSGWRALPAVVHGKLRGLRRLLRQDNAA